MNDTFDYHMARLQDPHEAAADIVALQERVTELEKVVRRFMASNRLREMSAVSQV